MILFLVGMPGVGKSYWGQRVAAHYGLPFIDLDVLISTAEGTTITEIFAQDGGADVFRQLERKYLMQAIATLGQDGVVATGGGTPCYYNNMQVMKEAGTVIYLLADPAYLYQNILSSAEIRPMLSGTNFIQEQLSAMLADRKDWYGLAHHILHAKDISLITFDKIIHHV